ncbi:MAG: hypothetical protein AAFV37_09950 [Pseudomonadota bacterium]|mgnify:CR=1
MVKRVRDTEKLERILSIMRLLQSHLEAADFDITEFEEVEIFLDLALAAGERYRSPGLEQPPKKNGLS